MNIRVKFNYEWHWGIPDGEEEFEVVVDWFDTRERPEYLYGDKYKMTVDIENNLRDIVTVEITTAFVIEHEGHYFKCEEIFLSK